MSSLTLGESPYLRLDPLLVGSNPRIHLGLLLGGQQVVLIAASNSATTALSGCTRRQGGVYPLRHTDNTQRFSGNPRRLCQADADPGQLPRLPAGLPLPQRAVGSE